MIESKGIELPDGIGTDGDGAPTLFKEDDKHVLVMYPGGDYDAVLNIEPFIEWLKTHKPELLQ